MGAPSALDTASRAALILERNVHFDSVGYRQRPFAGDAARYALPSGTAECRRQQTATAGSEDQTDRSPSGPTQTFAVTRLEEPFRTWRDGEVQSAGRRQLS